ncbi:MAG: phenylalanine--tRNA ligase subunit beta [DPANN group archaeon]|nr:phenylalanine--tRNA ligase subunit beta [DPANN group archaeon]
MPTVTLNRKEFEKLVGKALPTEELKDRLAYLGTDLDEVTDKDITVEIFPNRPDMLSEQGLARAFSSFIGVKGLVQYPVKAATERLIIEEPVKNVRPYTACAIVKGISFTDERIREVIQIQEKMHVSYGRNRKKMAIGIYPLEKIKMPIRYTALPPKEIRFRPLEASREMDGLQILSQHPAGREYGHLLEGKELFPVFIDANDEILSMPPLINSEKTGRINEQTKDVFVECSGFDFTVLHRGLNMIVTALADMGGEIHQMTLAYPEGKKKTPDLKPWEMDLSLAYVNRRLGLELSEKDLKEHLGRMGHGYQKGRVQVPAYRADIIHQVDLVEDIAIAYGYENFVAEMPKTPTLGEENAREKQKDRIAEILVGLGLLETSTYHITNKEDQLRKMEAKGELIELSNALTIEHSSLRRELLPMLLAVLSRNRHNEYPQRIFEMGSVFLEDKDGVTETGIREEEHLAVALCDAKADYTSIRQVLDYLMMLTDREVMVKPCEHPSFIPGRAGRIFIDTVEAGFIGEQLSPAVLANWELDMPVVGFEIKI